jgi:4-hydroxy-3-methylbut-2-en-1-yl diphosphate reductase
MKRVLLAEPRGFCAGVDRAVTTVLHALDLYGPPVYVRKHIVHNVHVVADLEARGTIFVESELDVPEGARLVLAAHGVEPSVHETAARRGLATIDATCPLVKKVHAEVRRFASTGYRIVLIGHAGHDEVVGTTGQAPHAITLVETAEQARSIDLPDAQKLAYATQTTLSVDETSEIVAILRERFPGIVGPRREDICYATTNRQRAVQRMLAEIDALVVVGSRESSNSNRLVETAEAAGVPAWLIEDETELDERRLADYDAVGVTAGASTPEQIVGAVCDWFRGHGVTDIRAFGGGPAEDVFFRLPPELPELPSATDAGSPRSDDARTPARARHSAKSSRKGAHDVPRS